MVIKLYRLFLIGDYNYQVITPTLDTKEEPKAPLPKIEEKLLFSHLKKTLYIQYPQKSLNPPFINHNFFWAWLEEPGNEH